MTAQAADIGLPWVLSAADPEALRAQATDLRERVLATPADGLAALARARADAGQGLASRAVVFGRDKDEAAARLERLAAGGAVAGLVRGEALTPRRLAFVFSPLRSEYPGMCLGLSEAFPVFAERMTAFERALEPLTGWAPADVLRGAPGAPELRRLDVDQPILVGASTALAEVWRSLGVAPDAVLGHSVGEIAAAAACGALSTVDAARVAATWGRSSHRLEGTGAMASLPLAAPEVERRLKGRRGRIAISGFNSPSWTAVSGEPGVVAELLDELAAEGANGRSMAIGAPGHSDGMDAIDPWFLEELKTISPGPGTAAFCSAVEGGLVDGRRLDAAYWSRNLRRPVLFEPAIRALRSAGCNVFVEIGPRPVLTAAIEEILDGEIGTAALGSWEQGEPLQLPLQLAEAYVHGVEVDWRPLCAERRRSPEQATPPRPLREAAAEQRQQLALDLVREVLGEVLGRGSEPSFAEDRSFRDFGVDSQAALALRNRLSQLAAVDLAKTAAFEHPTPSALAAHLVDLSLDRDPNPAPAPVRAHGEPGEPVAIVGVGCRYPGGADSPRQLWELVAAGREAISDFPADRGWELEGLFDPDPDRPGTSYVRRGGFLADVAGFDAAFFGIAPREARAMDPQQRLMLECAWEALEAAGADPGGLSGEPVGVFAGAFASPYGPSVRDAGAGVAGHLLTGTTPSVIAGRIAYALGFEGPALTVDTACSSSLVAIHLACRALRSGECSLALAGGVTVLSTPDLFVEFSRQRALAPDGRCKSFSAAADGTAWAEGCGVLVLAPLSEARRRGYPVLGLVRGSAINQDGASNGLTAPSRRAQELVIRQALADAGVDPASVGAVEAHGTGTPLGDPIEAAALLSTYGRERDGEPLRLGSIKSNIGHCSAAAGVAGTIKTLMAMRHGLLPQTLHVDQPSAEIEWSQGGVELLREAAPWPPGAEPRRAAVSSFGISGTNAHLVLEEPPPEPALKAASARLSFPLAAKSEQALRDQAQRLAEHLRAEPDISMADVAATLARRPRFACHAVLASDERDELLAGLDALAAGRPSPALVEDGNELGIGGDSGRVADLPTYPFQRRRFWLDPAAAGPSTPGLRALSHPVLSGALSLAGEDHLVLCGQLSLDALPWLADHSIGGVPHLPPAAFVELALAAARDVNCETVASLTIEAPLTLAPGAQVAVQVIVEAGTSTAGRAIAIHSLSGADGGWTRHATGVLGGRGRTPRRTPSRIPDEADRLDVDLLYRRLATRGLDYGPGLRLLQGAWESGEEAFAEVALPDSEGGGGFLLHPALAEAALQLAYALEPAPEAGPAMAFSWDGVSVGAEAQRRLQVRIAANQNGGFELAGFDEAGAPVLNVGLLRTQPTPIPAQ